ncbi:hypothetical protein BGW37DRAFT_550972, partial [Umbelopsis sp. PMI_123]
MNTSNNSSYCMQHDVYFDTSWCPRCTHIQTIEPEPIQTSDYTNYCLHHQRYFQTSMCPQCEAGDTYDPAPQLQVENHDPPTRAPQSRMALKCSLSSIEWKPQYAEALNNLFIKVNQLTIHTYMLSRFLFVRELSDDPNFNLLEYVTKDFFVEVFLSLTTRVRNDLRCSTQTLYYRRLIDTGINYYFMILGYRRIELKVAQQ